MAGPADFDALDWLACQYVHRGGFSPDLKRVRKLSSPGCGSLDFFRECYEIPPEVAIALSYRSLPNPGYIQTIIPRSSYSIVLNLSIRGNFRAESAILAHEMAHLHMDLVTGTLPETTLNERLTEAVVVGAGLGALAEFYFYKEHFDDSTRGMRVGYVTVEERAYLCARYFAAISGAPGDVFGMEFGRFVSALFPVAQERLRSFTLRRGACARCGTPVDGKPSEWFCPGCGGAARKGLFGWSPIFR